MKSYTLSTMRVFHFKSINTVLDGSVLNKCVKTCHTGKQYDENGSLRDWWTSKTEKKYNSKAKCFIGQYNRYKENITTLNVNGFNTQGENIADNGGLRMSFKVRIRFE